MSKVGEVVFCVDCDLARSAQAKVASGDSSRMPRELPRRIATKQDAGGDALCTSCLDARVQRRRAEFLKPRDAGAPHEPQPTASAVGAVDSPRKFSRVRVERVRPVVQAATPKSRKKKGSKRQVGRPSRSENKSGGKVAKKTVGSLKNVEAQLLQLVLEHGLTSVRRMLDRVNERIRKLV